MSEWRSVAWESIAKAELCRLGAPCCCRRLLLTICPLPDLITPHLDDRVKGVKTTVTVALTPDDGQWPIFQQRCKSIPHFNARFHNWSPHVSRTSSAPFVAVMNRFSL